MSHNETNLFYDEANLPHAEMMEKARKLVGLFHTAMLVTHAPDDTLVARPMGIAHMDKECTISFVTQVDSEKVDETLRNSAVAVTMQSSQAFISISGQASVILDQKEKERVWSLMDDVWFDGPPDSSAVLIRVYPDTIEYWDNRGLNSLSFAVEAVRALLAGDEPHATDQQHGVVASCLGKVKSDPKLDVS